jgi:ATP-dependent protease ClpP protease subunit
MQQAGLRFNRSAAVLSFHGEVNVESILRLTDLGRMAVSYYQAKTLELEIDSLGGDCRALDHFLDFREELSESGVRLITTGLTQACSAAAMMLTIGDVGFRRARKSCRLLFHCSRMSVPQQAVYTAEVLVQYVEMMKSIDTQYIDRVVAQVAKSSEKSRIFPDQIRSLFERDQMIKPVEALELGLIDQIV